MVSKLEQIAKDGNYKCRMDYNPDGFWKVDGGRYSIVWQTLPSNPDNKLKSKMIVECELAIEEFKIKYGILPLKAISVSNDSIYLAYTEAQK